MTENEIKEKGFMYIEQDGNNVIYQDKEGYKYSLKKTSIRNMSANGQPFRKKGKFFEYNMHLLMTKDNPYNTQIKLETFKSWNNNNTHFVCGMCGAEFKNSMASIQLSPYKICSKCYDKIKKTRLSPTEDVKRNIVEKGYTPLFDEFKGYHQRLKVQDKHGYVGLVKYDTLLKKGSISPFAKYNPYVIDNIRFYCQKNDIPCIIPNQIYNGWDNPLEIICACGNHYTTTLSHFMHDNKIQCNECSKRKSKNEKLVEIFLEFLSISFIREYRFKECRDKYSLPFDFYLPDYNICIEIDGEQHYKPVQFGNITLEKAIKNFEKVKDRDDIKTQYCLDNNIKLLRISYRDIKDETYKQKIMSLLKL